MGPTFFRIERDSFTVASTVFICHILTFSPDKDFSNVRQGNYTSKEALGSTGQSNGVRGINKLG